MPEEHFNGEFVTDDLGLAAFLGLKGHTYQDLEQRGGTKVVWVFDRCAPLEDLVVLFRDRRATVEPIAFQKALTDTRRDMFDFKDGLR
jgi:hypothetical protein